MQDISDNLKTVKSVKSSLPENHAWEKLQIPYSENDSCQNDFSKSLRISELNST